MKVWVVETCCYENRHVSGVYATIEAAIQAHPKGEWSQDTPDSWSNDQDWDDAAVAYEYEVES